MIEYLYTGHYTSDAQEQPDDSSLDSTSKSRPARKYSRHRYLRESPHTCDDTYGNCNILPLCPHHRCGENCAWDCDIFVCKHCTYVCFGQKPENLLVHAKMYEIADKYQLAGLKALARKLFASEILASWDHELFPAAAHYAFSTTVEEDKDLRDIIIRTIAEHTGLIRTTEIQALMTEFGGLAVGVLLAKADECRWK